MCKRLKCSFLAVAVIMAISVLPTTAFASGTAPSSSDTIVPFTLDVPTKPWNLNEDENGDYTADLQVVGKGWLYTNYYFYSNDTGNLYVDYDMTAEGDTVVEFGLYDIAQAEMVATWSTDKFGEDGITGSMYWYNLNMSHGYAIAFRSTEYSATGTAVITNH